MEGEELSFIDSTRLNCMQRRQEIIDDYYELVGLKDVKPAKKIASLKDRPVDLKRAQMKKDIATGKRTRYMTRKQQPKSFADLLRNRRQNLRTLKNNNNKKNNNNNNINNNNINTGLQTIKPRKVVTEYYG